MAMRNPSDPDNVQSVSESDETIGRNVQRLRGEVSQTALAAAMRERGHKWTQPTVVAVEKGERPLRLSEAHDLAELMGENVTMFLKSETEFSLIESFREVSGLFEDISLAADQLFVKQRRLAVDADVFGPEYFSDEDRRLFLARTAVDAAAEGTIRAFNDHLARQTTNDVIDGRPNNVALERTDQYLERIRGFVASYRPPADSVTPSDDDLEDG